MDKPTPDVVSRYRDPLLQVIENVKDICPHLKLWVATGVAPALTILVSTMWIQEHSVGACVMPWDFLVDLLYHTLKFSEDYVESEKMGCQFFYSFSDTSSPMEKVKKHIIFILT